MTNKTSSICSCCIGASQAILNAHEVELRANPILRGDKGDMAEEKKLSIGSITLDPARRHVEVGGRTVRLTSVEFNLLQMLMTRQGHVQERDRLLNEVWGYESVIDTRTVDTHVRRLRKKLGKAANAIETVRGFGYRIRERV
jgi:two-component system phosphate regulon response regulator PhoB